MKKYVMMNEKERIELIRQKHVELQLFQYLLRNCPSLDALYHGRAREIADGLQPWVDALEKRMRE